MLWEKRLLTTVKDRGCGMREATEGGGCRGKQSCLVSKSQSLLRVRLSGSQQRGGSMDDGTTDRDD